MKDNRRKPETSALRLLFEEQWNHLLGLIEKWDYQQQSHQQQSKSLSKAIETLVDGTDVRMRCIGNYKKRLRASVRSILIYVCDLVAKLPASITVNKRTFSTDPLVNTLFVTTEDIKQLFSNCSEFHQFFELDEYQQQAEVYSLLFVRMSEKTIFGRKIQGEMLLGDEMQIAVNFSEHELLFPSKSEALVRSSLETLLFDEIVDCIKTNMAQLHQEQLNNSQSLQQNLDKSLKNPEVYLQTLIEHLAYPAQLIQLQQSTLKISKLGIRLEKDDTEAANEIQLNMLKIGNLPPRIATFIRYPKSELDPKVDMFN